MQNTIMNTVEAAQLRDDIPYFNPGDTLRVLLRVIEGEKERIQTFEGVVIAKKNGGLRETFTIRKVSYGVGIEKIFFMNSRIIKSLEVVKRGKVRRAKLYYLRDRRGKSARIKEKKVSKN
jgi:large subunit ribosomal protein L19